MKFTLKSLFSPTGDQPKAISSLSTGITSGMPFQTLLGVTGSGKTFTIAGVIQEVQKPTLVIAPNKTLAAQLCGEFREFFPDHAVEYFVSYYDYYQPEAYVPQTDTYIEKDSSLNEELDKLRHSATASIFERDDVIIVASVSCIYGLGSPVYYREMMVSLRQGMNIDRDQVIARLVDIHYQRNDYEFTRGCFRVRGDVLEIFPASFTEKALRVEFFGDEIDRILEIDTLTGEVLARRLHAVVFPASHYVTAPEQMERAIQGIEKELDERLAELRREDKLLEAQRLEQRTRYDLEMMREVGICKGIENYSRHLTGRKPGEPPYCLLDFFPEDFMVVVRGVIGFFTLLIFTRLLGKQQIGQLSFFDYILGITIGSIAANLTTDLTSRAWPHWVGLAVWSILVVALQWLTLKWRYAGKYIDGEPTVVIMNGKIMENTMKKLRYRTSELLEQLRLQNVFDISQVEFAVLEVNGQLSVLKKSQYQTVTTQDLGISTNYQGIGTELIYDGVVVEQNLRQVNLDRTWLDDQLRIQGINDPSEVFLANLDTQGKLYIDKYKDHLQKITDIGDYPGPH